MTCWSQLSHVLHCDIAHVRIAMSAEVMHCAALRLMLTVGEQEGRREFFSVSNENWIY